MILGIDPGVRKLGFALISKDLRIIDSWILLQDQKNPSRKDQFHRMSQIFDFFQEMFQKNKIEKICMEKLFFTKYNQNNAEFVFGIRGILMMLAIKNGAALQEFSPIELKKFITGNGKAEKLLVQRTVMKIFKLQEMPEYNDAADALGLAYLWSRII